LRCRAIGCRGDRRASSISSPFILLAWVRTAEALGMGKCASALVGGHGGGLASDEAVWRGPETIWPWWLLRSPRRRDRRGDGAPWLIHIPQSDRTVWIWRLQVAPFFKRKDPCLPYTPSILNYKAFQ
jgi:hypothetical protein